MICTTIQIESTDFVKLSRATSLNQDNSHYQTQTTMASKAAANTVLLELLDRHLENKPHEHAGMTIDGVKHEVTSSALDLLVKDTASPLIAARLILTLRDVSQPDGTKGQPTTELAAHIVTTTDPDQSSSSSTTSVIIDKLPKAHGGPPPAPPHRASTIPTHPPTGPSRRRPLAETYRDYILAFMADQAAAATDLPRFLHRPVTHNARALTVSEYHGLGQVVRDAVPDLGCEIVDLIADEARQVVAARLEFSGALERPFAGAQPPAAVRIGEIVFYWFEAGRIREVVSLVDMRGLGAAS